MIRRAEVDEWAARFGVAPPQIERDHFISHLLVALHLLHPSVRFFGGTALCRTYLEGSRLSEDVDLLDGDPRAFLAELEHELPRALRREFPGTTWTSLPPEGDGLAVAIAAPDLTAIKVYVGRDGADARAWQFESTEVQLRYDDLDETVTFQCPTLPTFAAMKLAAWFDRHAPRDLFDLAGLAGLGVFEDDRVEAIFRTKMGIPILAAEFTRAPRSTIDAWVTELAAQVGSLPSTEHCLEVVRRALG